VLNLSEPASRKLNEILASQEKPIYGLRVHAMAGCCSGPSYGMSLATEAAPGDWEGTFAGVKVLVDAESAALLEGASIDWVETPEGSGFTIQSPNAVQAGGGCGCGHGHSHADAQDEAHSHGGGGCGCGGH
jgi:iron-sulfur cluster assembly accessory protein